jgi:hypothetical protein
MSNVGIMTPPLGWTSYLQFAFGIPQNLRQSSTCVIEISMQFPSTLPRLPSSILLRAKSPPISINNPIRGFMISRLVAGLRIHLLGRLGMVCEDPNVDDGQGIIVSLGPEKRERICTRRRLLFAKLFWEEGCVLTKLAYASVRIISRMELESPIATKALEFLIRIVVVTVIQPNRIALGIAGRRHAEGLVAKRTERGSDPGELLSRRRSAPPNLDAVASVAFVTL